jgi:hypothetical protein
MHNDSSRSLRQAGSAEVSGEARGVGLVAEGRDADVPLDGELRVELDQAPGRGARLLIEPQLLGGDRAVAGT